MTTVSGSPDWLPNVRPQADYDVLFDSNVVLNPTHTLSVSPLDGVYQSIFVEVQTAVASGILIAVANVSFPIFYEPIYDSSESSRTIYKAWFPFFNVPGDTLDVVITASSPSATPTPVVVLGLREQAPAFRSDGRLTMRHSRLAQHNGTASASLITAPSGNQQNIMIGSVSVVSGFASSGVATVAVRGVFQGVAVPICRSKAGTAFIVGDSFTTDEGLCVDYGQAVDIVVTGTLADDYQVRVTYDYV